MATTDHSHPQGAHGAHGSHGVALNHETTDVSLTGITRIAILSFAIIFVILGVVYGVWKAFASYAADTRQPSPLAASKPGQDRLPTGPLVLTDEPGALRQLRAQEQQILEHYGWVDKNQGIVRVPIERAMELLAEQPARIAPGGAVPAAPAAPGAAEPAAPAKPAAHE